MKIGIKLLLAGVFATFTVLSFAQSNDNGDNGSKSFRSQMKPLVYHKGKISPHKHEVKKAPKMISPIKSTTLRK